MKPIKHGELTGATDSKGWAVYLPESGAVHYLNETARAIWELCDGETTEIEMSLAITELTGQPIEKTSNDVSQTLTSLAELGLVTT